MPTRAEIRDAIVDRLRANLPSDIDVFAYTDPDSFRGVRQNAAILVSNAGTSRPIPTGLFNRNSPTIQIATLNFLADIYYKDLRTFTDAEDLVENVVIAINGYIVPGTSTKLFSTGDRPVRKIPDSKLWNYEVNISAQVKQIYG